MKQNLYYSIIFLLSISYTHSSALSDREAAQLLADEELAQSLALEHPVLDGVWMPKSVRDSYASYDKAVTIGVKFDMNVHTFNAVTGLRTRLPILMANDIFSDETRGFAETRAAIEASDYYQDFAKKAVLGANLDRLAAHLTTSKIEASETGTDVEKLLSRVWSLGLTNESFAQQILISICDNSETGGGCYQGHAGRLARLYVNFLRAQWLE